MTISLKPLARLSLVFTALIFVALAATPAFAEEELTLDDPPEDGFTGKTDAAPPEDLILDELGDIGGSDSKPAPTAPARSSQDKFAGNFSEVSITDIRVTGGQVLIETSSPATFHSSDKPQRTTNQCFKKIPVVFGGRDKEIRECFKILVVRRWFRHLVVSIIYIGTFRPIGNH